MLKTIKLVLTLFSLFGTLRSAPTTSVLDNYAIIFDAGSGGTRMTVFKYELVAYQVTNIPSNIEELLYTKLATGDIAIDSLQTPSDVEALFQEGFQIAESLIPQQFHSKTFVSLAATAGMRLLEVQNPVKANMVYNLIRNYFRTTKFPLANNDDVKTLSGTDEGIDEWLTVNFLLDNFKSARQTLGLIRLGGSSTQIAFLSKRGTNAIEHDYYSPFHLNGIDQHIYAHSYLCWGINRAFDFYHTKSIKEASFKKQVASSCYPKGYSIEEPEISFYNLCTNGQVLNYLYDSFTIPESEWSQTNTHVFYGGSNNLKCKEDVAAIVPKPECPYAQCAYDSVYQPTAGNLTFMAAGDYNDIIKDTSSLLQTNIDTIEKLEDATYFICQSTYDELIAINKAAGSGIKKTVHLLCFQNRYLLELFRSYGIQNFQIVNKINGYKVGWTMGYLMSEIKKTFQ